MNEKINGYHTRELRWFHKKKITDIEEWFNSNGCFFEKQNERIDFYLDLFPEEKISFKIREGKTEIKMQVEGTFSPFAYGEHRGNAQNWIKWGFNLKKDLVKPENIFDETKDKFIEVIKRRLLVKYELHSNGEINKKEGQLTVADGGQVEFTQLKLRKETWYSFAFEAFGTSELLIRSFELVSRKVLGEMQNLKLEEKDSFSYPVLLRVTHC